MHSYLSFLPSVLYLLSAAVFIVAIFRHLKLSPVLGYFVAGSFLGPYGMNVVNPDHTMIFGEIGIVFLLFAIGLELTIPRLKAMRTHVFGFGSLQVTLSAVFIYFGLIQLGFKQDNAVIIALALAMSSTAIVLQVMAESRIQSTQVGRLSLATLLMQDFAVVPLLVLVPLMSKKDIDIVNVMGAATGKAVLALLIIFFVGRLLLRPIFNIIDSQNVAKNNEIFVATTLLIALAAAYTTEQLGLSLALGAFAAGLLVAETEYQHQAEESIAPFKGLLLGLFFMNVGMTMNLDFISQNYIKIALLSIGLLSIKASIIFGLSKIFKFSTGVSFHTGLLLSQGGEFAFILFKLAQDQKIINSSTSQLLMIVVTTTMAITPLLSTIGGIIASKLDASQDMNLEDMNKETADLENHIIVIGFGRVGKMVARLLEAEKVHYISTDIDSTVVEEGRKEGFPLYPVDSCNIRMLENIGISRAQSVIFTIKNEVTLMRTLRTIRDKYDKVPIIVRSEDLSEEEKYINAGATNIVPETYETGLQLAGAVLKSVGFSEFEVSRIKNRFRDGDYVYAKAIDEA
jgi:monovalent cation:H+ antiporter-2, CPA2 family